MLRPSRILVIPLVAAGLWLASPASEAQAQLRVRVGGYYGSTVYRGGHYFTPNHNARSSYYRGHGGHHYGRGHHVYGGHHGGHGYFHDTSHFDYHPPSYYWHGNHLDFVPGHYDLHRSGHYHHW